MAACQKRACPFPATANGFCAQHNRLEDDSLTFASIWPRDLNERAAEDIKVEDEPRPPTRIQKSRSEYNRWTELKTRLLSLADGESLVVRVPDGETKTHYRNNLRSILSSGKGLRDLEWATRSVEGDDSAVQVIRVGLFSEHTSAATIPEPANSKVLDGPLGLGNLLTKLQGRRLRLMAELSEVDRQIEAVQVTIGLLESK